MWKITGFLFVAAAVLSVASCSVTNNLSDDQYILNRNKVNTDPVVDKEDKITAKELNRYIRQQPAPKLLGTNLPIWIYNQAKPEVDDGWNNFLRRLGSEPTLLDTTLTHMSAVNIKSYMDKRGFRESVGDYQITYRPKRQRAVVSYTVWQGKGYRIGEISYDFQDKFLEQVIKADSANTLLRTGDLFDEYVLEAEQVRIASYLHDRGYYSFSTENIHYTAYMDEGDYVVDLKMTIRQHLAGYDSGNNPIMENNAVYRIAEIYIFPDYDLTEAAVQGDAYFQKLDTVYYQGIGVVSRGKPKVKPATLRRAVNLYTGDIYSLTDRRRAAENIMQLGIYRNANVTPMEVESDEDEYVTYTGGGEAEQTLQKQLKYNVYCTPYLRQSYTIDLEGTMTELFYGLKVNASYQNRNLLRGSEQFDVGLTAGYEFYRSEEQENSFELGATVGLSFPRFITPFRVDRANRAAKPTTRVEVSINTQNRPDYYNRTITGAGLSYSWANRHRSTFTLRPLSFNLVKSELQEKFRKILDEANNEYLRQSYSSMFVPAITFSHVYSNPVVNTKGHSSVIRTNLETAGNLSTLISGWIEPDRDMATVFGVQIAQYARADVNASYTMPLGGKSALASRIFIGVGIPYGNLDAMPIDRQYYSGGAYSMRGWQVRTLGPGSYLPTDDEAKIPMRTGDIRLEVNTELRFPIAGAFNGALFLDAGNVWMLYKKGETDNKVFRFNDFYRQLGFNTGLGLRVDIQLIVLRLDWGIQLHNPNRPEGNRWIRNFKWANTALNFGVGYPF